MELSKKYEEHRTRETNFSERAYGFFAVGAASLYTSLNGLFYTPSNDLIQEGNLTCAIGGVVCNLLGVLFLHKEHASALKSLETILDENRTK